MGTDDARYMSEDPQPPDATLVRPHWIPRRRADWVRDCDKILMDHGEVQGTVAYKQRHHARWRAQSLIRMLVELRLHERWELREHVAQQSGGWVWSVEYLPRGAADAGR
jgi:hypothetical protein